MDYANSYTHLLNNEHMQLFWTQPTTTIFGAVLKVAVANLSDKFFYNYPEEETGPFGQVCYEPAVQRARLLETLKKHGHNPEITVMHALLPPNTYHDTTGVQHFFEHQFYPWLWGNTVGLDAGVHYARSDGCGGQFKSARHFRFISNFAQYGYTRDVRLVWSHFESCHGKNLSHPECGRLKYIPYRQEMRHNVELPTEMKLSLECFNYLRAHHTKTNRSMDEKKGRGIHTRVLHFTTGKDIRALSSLAEVKTLEGVNQARSEAPKTRSSIQQMGYERAKTVCVGMFVGSENAEEQEPFILFVALEAEHVWVGESSTSWNGVIKAGDKYIKARKLHRSPGLKLVYTETDCVFYLNSEDVRVADMKAVESDLS